jgi:hypothetical protein
MEIVGYEDLTTLVTKSLGSRAVAQRLVAVLPPRRPGFATGQYVVFQVDKAALGQVFSEYFGFPCQASYHQFLHHHNHPGLAQQAYWWPQCRTDPVGLHPPLHQFKENMSLRYKAV